MTRSYMSGVSTSLLWRVKDRSRSLGGPAANPAHRFWNKKLVIGSLHAETQLPVGSRAGQWEVTGHVTQNTRCSCMSLGSSVDMLACS